MTPPLLTISGLSFSYPDQPEVLRGIDLTIMTGERVGLIGPNGAGKTTLFLLSCGILRPDAGEIRLAGEPLMERAFDPRIALVFQKSDDQLFCPTVREDIAFGPENMGLPPAEIQARVTAALKAVGGENLAERPVHHLSEGEKRLVAIAGVLAMEPELIIYDEPSAGLDIRSRRRLIALLKKSRKSCLIAAHDLELILEVCDRVLLLDRGQIVADGPPRRIMADEALMRAHGQEKPHSLIPHQQPHHHPSTP